MSDLISYKNAQIDALQRKVHELEKWNVQLGTWVFELADKDTPQEYRDAVLKDISDFMVDYIT